MGNLEKLLLGALVGALAVGATYVVLQEPGPRKTDKAFIGFIFDDGNSDIYAHRELFASQGVKVSVAIISDQIGRECCKTWQQARELQDEYGWTFMNHTQYHRHFSRINVDKVRRHVHACHRKAERYSLELEGLVYPYNDTGSEEKRKVVAELYPFAFSGGGQLITKTSNAYRLGRYNIDKNTTEEIKKVIDVATKTGSGLILYGHHIVDGTKNQEGYLSISENRVNEIIEYIQSHSGNIDIALPSRVVQNSTISP